jgi:phenylacetate-CoA ligase
MGLTNTYLALPAWLQNVAVSAYGYKLHFERYWHADVDFKHEINSNLDKTPEELANYRLERLKKVISRAALHVPFYRDYFAREHLSAADFRSLSDLKLLPIITREDLRRDPMRFVADDIPADRLLYETTSGSTGAPIKVFYTKDDLRRHYLFFQRLRDMSGVRRGMRRITFNSRVIMDPARKRPPYWRYDLSENSWHFSNYHLTPETIGLYCQKIIQVNPEEIVSYPSSLHQIGRYILDQGLPRLHPVSIIVSGENLLPEHQSVIEQAFQCHVTDQYGCTEKTIFVHKCHEGHFHIHNDYSIVEVLNSAGQAITDGFGDVTTTSLFNETMPLIRYQIGDLVELDSRISCTCGLPFPTFKGIVGRKDDFILTPSGKRIYRLAIWEGMDSVVASQLVQHAPNKLEVRIVRDSNYSQADEDHILTRLKMLFDDELQVYPKYTDLIPKEKNGKFKFIVRNF